MALTAPSDNRIPSRTIRICINLDTRMKFSCSSQTGTSLNPPPLNLPWGQVHLNTVCTRLYSESLSLLL